MKLKVIQGVDDRLCFDPIDFLFLSFFSFFFGTEEGNKGFFYTTEAEEEKENKMEGEKKVKKGSVPRERGRVEEAVKKKKRGIMEGKRRGTGEVLGENRRVGCLK